jgi:hypothetical protein
MFQSMGVDKLVEIMQLAVLNKKIFLPFCILPAFN